LPLQVSVVTPEREVWSGESDFVLAKAAGGDIGVLPGHAPFLGALKHSFVKISHGDGSEVLMAVHAGFIEVFEDHVTILAPEAELAEEINIEDARRYREEAEREMREGDTIEAYEKLLRADARLRTAAEAGLLQM
jgi:F-type H+-transporting ATPase subunit epsilon